MYVRGGRPPSTRMDFTARRRFSRRKVSTCVLELLARSVKKPHPYVNLARASSLCGELGHHIAEDCDWLPGMHTGLSLSVSREFHSLGPRRGHAPGATAGCVQS